MDFSPLIIRHDIELSVLKTNFSFLKHLFCWYEENEFSYYLHKRIAYQIQVPTNDKERRYLCFNQAYQYLLKHAQESEKQIIIKTFFQTLFDRNNVLTDGLTFTFMGKRLVNATKTGTFDVPSMSFSYDYSGKRLSKTINGVIHQYYYDGDKLVYETETEVSSSILLHEKKFFYDENGILTFMELDGVRYFYYIDATHMVRGLFNSDGEFIVRYSYDAWGNVTNIVDHSSISLSLLNPFLFKCYYYDHESKWYYCLSRYYVPLWMRWLSIDDSSYLTSEIPAGYNLYVYCNNNPIMCEDPSGEASFWSQIGDWFKKTFGFFVDATIDIYRNGRDFFFGGFELGEKNNLTYGNDNKPISFYVTNASKWYNFWEYQIGFKINIGNSSFSMSVGLGEMNFTYSYKNSSFNLQIGVNKIGFEFSEEKNGVIVYSHFYIRTIPTVLLVLACIYAPFLLPAGSLPVVG